MNFSYCPRCGDQSYESLATHSYCPCCNYSPTLDEKYEYAIPKWALDVLKEGKSPADILPSAGSNVIIGFVPRKKAKLAIVPNPETAA